MIHRPEFLSNISAIQTDEHVWPVFLSNIYAMIHRPEFISNISAIRIHRNSTFLPFKQIHMFGRTQTCMELIQGIDAGFKLGGSPNPQQIHMFFRRTVLAATPRDSSGNSQRDVWLRYERRDSSGNSQRDVWLRYEYSRSRSLSRDL